jgi:uncharacterized protein
MTLAENIPIVAPLVGGALIGLATALLLLLNGRIAGVSGILGRSLRLDAGPGAWRPAFLVGLLSAMPAYQLWQNHLPAYRLDADLVTLFLAGILVGVGTRVGTGCTSGHGVCGISNLSPRSLVATVTFMITAALVVYLQRHVLA